MARKPLLATGVLIALATVSGNPPHPALPPLPGAPSAPPPPPPNLAALVQPPMPNLQPPAPKVAWPPAPPRPGPFDLAPPIPPTAPPNLPPDPILPRPHDIVPVAPASPPPVQILEPVSAVHRFEGTYLGGTSTRALVYAEADGKAEVRVYAVGGEKEPLARCAVPVDKPVFGFGGVHVEGQELPAPRAVKQAFSDGRAFVLTARELTVVGIEGRAEWSFALPGRANNGERFVGLAGFDRGNVLLASSDPKERGRVYALNTETGKQVAFWKFEGGFHANALFAVDAQSRMLFVASGSAFWILGLDRAHPPAPRAHESTAHHLSAMNGRAFFGKPSGAFVSDGRELWHLTREAAGTGPTGFAVTPNGSRAFVPVRGLRSGQHRLAAFSVRGMHNSPVEWTIDVPKAITAPPVARGDSVYFVAGPVLYRANATTGAVHWKHTLALEANDALTGLAFDGDDLVAWGGGVVARVTDRGDPVTPIAPAPRERVRQAFNFGGGLFPSQ